MREYVGRVIDVQARWLARWLHSRWAFVQLVYGTIFWIPFVAFGLDPHGYLYLYVATSLSLITQSPIAMLALWAAQEAHRNEELTMQMLKNQTDTMRLLLEQFEDLEEDITQELKAHHDDEEAG